MPPPTHQKTGLKAGFLAKLTPNPVRRKFSNTIDEHESLQFRRCCANKEIQIMIIVIFLLIIAYHYKLNPDFVLMPSRAFIVFN